MKIVRIYIFNEDEFGGIADIINDAVRSDVTSDIVQEMGWWTPNGNVIGIGKDEKEASIVALHEFVEFLLERVFGFEHKLAHRFASKFEKCFEMVTGDGGCPCKDNEW